MAGLGEAFGDGFEFYTFGGQKVLFGQTVDRLRESSGGFVPTALGEEDFAEFGDGEEAGAEVGVLALFGNDDGAEDLFGFGVLAAGEEEIGEVDGRVGGFDIGGAAGGEEAFVGIAGEGFGAGRVGGANGAGEQVHSAERVGVGGA